MMELNEKQFISGFNSGYLLAEYEPQILTVLLKNTQTVNSYLSGMSCEKKEYELLQSKGHLNELNQIRQKTRDKKDRDRH
ncbi:MAG: hypothetical protein IPJ53_13255 [Saprospiraceae bacterium]|nr:hypothetical protein [Candidatus Vicinibacter affinis]